jgi:protein-disulfide isomerase-like protein with CxxC motif
MEVDILKKITAIVLIGLFSQFSMADQASASKAIVDILIGMNHFASDTQKAELMAIAADDSSGRGYIAIANAVHGIQHAPTAEGKEAMTRVMGAAQAPAEVKALAEIVLGFNHMASAEAQAVLEGMR